MAILEGDDWPGNVRELEAVVKRAMVRRRAGWVTPADVILPRLRRDRLARAMRALGITITAAQEQAMRDSPAARLSRRLDRVPRIARPLRSILRALVR